MKERKCIKINLSTFFLIITIIVIVIMGGIIFSLNNEKTSETKRATELQDQVNTLNSTVNSLQEKINKVSDVINSENTTDEVENTSVEQPANNTSSSSTTQDKYTEITSTLSDDDVFYATSATKNDDGSYTLKGVLYTRFTLSKAELENAVTNGSYKYEGETYTVMKKNNSSTFDMDYVFTKNGDDIEMYAEKKDNNTYYIERATQISKIWTLTDNYRKITLSSDIVVENDYTEVKTTVNEYFKNFKDSGATDTTNPYPCFTFNFSNGKCTKIVEETTSI